MNILPIRRDIRFTPPADRVSNWHPGGPVVTQFINALSLFFPAGERFFIQSVRNYRDRITDPELQKAVTAFIGQEAMHTREHEGYNDIMQAAGLPAEALEETVRVVLERVKKQLPPSSQLAITIALEHYTALLADWVLGVESVTAGTEPHYGALWQWHAMEETEHKAVAYDVWETVRGKGAGAYLERASVQLLATAIFMGFVAVYTQKMVQADPKARGVKNWLQLGDFLLGRQGFLRRSFLPWLDYFRPNFHPWQHDNRQFLERIPELIKTQNELMAKAA